MRYTLLALTALTLFSLPANAKTIEIGVNGLICDFCAQGIKKTFGKVAEIESTSVDLDHGKITLVTKADADLTDEDITKRITDSGYTVTGISRKE